ncbi:MAG: hypothetical protein Q9220_007225 [cf. Caloplaca sp. 1 TL-2023]
MFIAIHHLVGTLLYLASVAVAKAIPSPAGAFERPSQALTADPAANSLQPVDTNANPDWAGEMTPNDCLTAGYDFQKPIASYDENQPLHFWSWKWTSKPQGTAFPLPYGAVYRTCTILLRMGKDFGDNVLPLQYGGFLDGSIDAPLAVFRWFDILFELPDLLQTVRSSGKPVWTTGMGHGGRNAIIMFIPSDSVIAKRWATDIRRQKTSLLQVVGSTSLNGTDDTQSA